MRKANTFLLGALCTLLLVLTFLHFSQLPQVQAQAGSGHKQKYIASATDTAVADGNAYLESITINGGTGGAVTLYDIAATGCTGTPASGKFATIASASAPVTLFYQLRTFNGLCLVTAAATDLTVTFD